MRISLIACTLGMLIGGSTALARDYSRDSTDLYLQRPGIGDRLDRYSVPGSRLRVDDIPGTGRSAVYNQRGERQGYIERKSYGGAVFYNNRGERARR